LGGAIESDRERAGLAIKKPAQGVPLRGSIQAARRLASANPVLSLMKGELLRAGELAYEIKNIEKI
jgi:hypothetical protein